MKKNHIEALEQKDDGCTFCNADGVHDAEDILFICLGDFLGKQVTSRTYIFGNSFVQEIELDNNNGTDTRTRIEYCPFCGRKL